MRTKQHTLFFNHLQKDFPKTFVEIKNNQLMRDQLISPFILETPKHILQQAQKLVAQVHNIKESETYHRSLIETEPRNWPEFAKSPSILNCFDFHHSEEMGLKLIEINTNASLYLTSHILYGSHQLNSLDKDLESLKDSFEQSFSQLENETLFIMDREPKKEGLYFEFLLFQEWLEKLGIHSELLNARDFDPQMHKQIYNRFTDFYFSENESKNLASAYIQKESLFSPNPREYFFMADKNRLPLLRKLLLEKDPDLGKVIPESKLFKEFESKEDVWAQRKKYFFKPSQSFGSKGVFSGKGISKKAFESIYAPDFMAQELCPAGKKTFDYEGEEVTMKFDLRFYTFEGEIQHTVARLYQGQATNMKTDLGGLAPIKWK